MKKNLLSKKPLHTFKDENTLVKFSANTMKVVRAAICIQIPQKKNQEVQEVTERQALANWISLKNLNVADS